MAQKCQKCFKNAKNCSKMQFFSSSTRRFAVALPLLELSHTDVIVSRLRDSITQT